MVFQDKTPEQLNESELMSVAMVLRDLKDAAQGNQPSATAVKSYLASDVSGGKQNQPYYYAIREHVNKAKPELLDYLAAQGVITSYQMLTYNLESLDYVVAINESVFNPFYNRILSLTMPYVEKLINTKVAISHGLRKPEAVDSHAKQLQAVLDINGFTSPVVHITSTPYTMPNMKDGKARDIIIYCFGLSGQKLSLEEVVEYLKSAGKKTYMGLTNLSQALRRSQFDKNNGGALAVFVDVSAQDIKLNAIKLITQKEADKIIFKSVN